ncbi:hypothetical protein G5S37_12950 [Roseimicrobium sp. ORNL1]|nr:hypothetical protein G5S37_12950 [Roseimicrobium sp. ORNL1]
MEESIPLEELTKQLHAALEPTLEELRYAVSLHPGFSVVSSGIGEDGPVHSWIGLTSERVDNEMPEVTLSISCVLIRWPETVDTTLRCAVGWYRSATLGGLDGFCIYESGQPPIQVGGFPDLSRASQHFPRLKAAYLKALDRGTPPSRTQQFWNRHFRGCPPPMHFSLNNQ